MVTWSKVKVNFGTLCITPCGQDTDYSFCPITFKLHIEVVDGERRNPVDFGSRVKGQGQLWHSVYKTLWTRFRLQFFVHSLSNFTCKLLMMREETLLILGHRVKGEGQVLYSVYKALLAQYRLQFMSNHFQTSHVDDKRRNRIDFGSRSQGQLCPPARGYHALRCLVFFFL